jgi:hypothetical protein
MRLTRLEVTPPELLKNMILRQTATTRIILRRRRTTGGGKDSSYLPSKVNQLMKRGSLSTRKSKARLMRSLLVSMPLHQLWKMTEDIGKPLRNFVSCKT